MRFWIPAATAIAGLFLGSPAQAFERQHHVGIGPELGLLKIDDKSTLSVGGGLRAHYTYGLTDSFNLLVEGAGNIVALDQGVDSPTTPHTRPSSLYNGAVGVAYVLDVLQFVPYGGVLAEGTLLTGGTLDKAHLIGGVSAVLGLDWQLHRNFAVGIAGRQHFLLTDFSRYPSFTTVGIQAEYVFGW